MSKAKKEIVEEVEVSPLSKGDTPDFHWYVIHALSGYENRVKKNAYRAHCTPQHDRIFFRNSYS